MLQRLAEWQRGGIRFLYSRGWSFADIAREVGCDRRTVARWAHRHSLHDNPRSGRKPLLSSAQLDFMVKQMSGKKHYGTRKMTEEFHRLGFRISRRTTQRATHRADLRGFVMQRRPLLTPAMVKKRLKFAKDHLQQDLRQVVFSDEKSYNGFFVQNRHNDIVYARSSSEVPFARTFKYPPFQKAVLFMSRKKVSRPFFYTGKLTSSLYIQALKASGLADTPKAFVQHGNVLLFHDGDSAHTAKATQAFLAEKGIEVVHPDAWPANSPDLNPIENLQSWLGDMVCEQEPESADDVKRAVRSAVDSVPRSMPRSLIDSFPDRLHNVIAAKGGNTKHY